MQFLTSLYQSIYHFSWLGVQKDNKGKAFSYSLFFLFLLVLLQFLPLMWGIPRQISALGHEFRNNLPDFEATVGNGALTVANLPQPYVKDLNIDGMVFRVAVDTVATTTPTIEEYKNGTDTVVLLTREGYASYDKTADRTESQSWSIFATTSTVTRSQVVSIIDKVSGTIGYFIAPLFIVGAYLVTVVGKLAYLAFISLVVWGISMIAKRAWTYGQVYTVGLYALTLPSLLQLLMFATGAFIPFLYTVVLVGYLIAAIWQEPRVPMTVPPSTEA